MTDLVDYLTNDRPGLDQHPAFQELASELEIGVLDFADDTLRSWIREHGDLAAKMADRGWIQWIAIPIDHADVRVGMTLVFDGRLARVVEDLTMNKWGISVDDPDGRQGWRYRVTKSDRLQRWVPVPLDAATLGRE